ncbi:MAG TPA: GDP-L-fucose synthase [Desulfatirhabdiaceae bacterium]|nr:GDP-L-fucose synthase [Desulfatirhabdiaceae bacterium]
MNSNQFLPKHPDQAHLHPKSRIFVAGHRGMVGSAIVRRLETDGFTNIVVRTHAELDLMDQQAVRSFFQQEAIDHVVLAAAKVGGIQANHTYPADFIYQNLMIETNVIHEAYRAGIRRLLFLGSSCIYPRLAPQPIREEYLLSDFLEPTNKPYAIAKIAGIELCDAYNRQYGTCFRSVMPTNLYGPNDNYNLENSHVLPAMIRKFHLAKLVLQHDRDAIQRDVSVYGPIPEDIRKSLGIQSNSVPEDTPKVMLWGSGSPRREFLHVDDLASACVFIMGLDDASYNRTTNSQGIAHINIGCGQDISIRDLSKLVQKAVGFMGQVLWDESKPDGTPQKLLDISRLNDMGWQPEISLENGIRQTYASYI